jgi:hypothetical protein
MGEGKVRDGGIQHSMNVARVTVMAISQGLEAFVWSILVESAMVPAAIFAPLQ